MASGNSGTLQSANMQMTTYLNARFDWNVTNINSDAGTATLNYKVYIDGSDTIEYRVYGTGDRNYFKINGNTVWAFYDTGNGSYSNPYKMFCRQSQHNMNIKWAEPPYYTFSGYILRYGILAEGSMTIYYDDNGNASFNVFGAFQCYYGAGMDKRVYINDTIYLNKIERNSSVKLKRNGAWDNKAGKIWHKENGSWVKRNYYRRENGSWNKK